MTALHIVLSILAAGGNIRLMPKIKRNLAGLGRLRNTIEIFLTQVLVGRPT